MCLMVQSQEVLLCLCYFSGIEKFDVFSLLSNASLFFFFFVTLANYVTDTFWYAFGDCIGIN